MEQKIRYVISTSTRELSPPALWPTRYTQYIDSTYAAMDEPFTFVEVNRIPANQLSFKRRSGGKTALEILQRTENLRISVLLAAFVDDSDSDKSDDDDSDDEENEEENEIIEELAILYLQMIVEGDAPRRISIRNIEKKIVTTDLYSEDECWRLLRFRKEDIANLMNLLNMPPHFISVDRHKYTRDFSLILLLRRMAYPGRLTDLEQEFGRDHTSLSRCIGITVAWLDANHSHRITDNLLFWMPYQQSFAAAVAAKTDVPEEFLNVTSFIDGTQKSFCRPSDGHNRPDNAQHSWYSGYYRAHGMKFQSMMYPSGKK